MGRQTGGYAAPIPPQGRLVRFLFWLFPSVRGVLYDAWREGYWMSVAEGQGNYAGDPMPSFVDWPRRGGRG